ncbi:MAG: protein-S-isoprenylcysteine O-methyltransferase [Pseudomonadota bacterium]
MTTAAQPADTPSRPPAWQRILPQLIYLGLIIAAAFRYDTLGWPPFVWIAGSVALTLIRAPFAKANKANVINEHRRGFIETVLLIIVFLFLAAFPNIQLATGVLSFADYRLPEAAAWTGAALQIPFIWLFWRSHADLGRNWSVSLELREDHGLVTNGVYKRIRHPMYSSIWLGALAQPLLVQNWIAGALAIPAFGLMYLIRVPREEAMMRARFGDAYHDYMRQTGRVLPRLRQAN